MKTNIIFIFCLLFFKVQGQDTLKYQVPGQYSWFSSDSITIIKVQCWGGGGPGGHGGYGSAGYGGGGGGYSESYFFVKPNLYYYLSVGKGGIPTNSYDNWPPAKPGENSWFNKLNSIPSDYINGVIAYGAYISGGAGNKFSGGSGCSPYQYNHIGVGGASSASEYGNGINSDSKSEIGRDAPLNGGRGGGGFPGGGGNGATSDHTHSGGSGGNGQVIISTLRNCGIISEGLKVDLYEKYSCGGTIEIKSTNYKFENGLQYTWQISHDSLNWSNLKEFDNDSIINYNITKSLNYFRIKTNCKFTNDSIFSNNVKHQIYDDILLKGIVSSNQKKCQGDYVDDITIKEYKGIIQWQTSIDNIHWNEIENESDDTLVGLKLGKLTINTFIRAKLSSYHCGIIYSDIITIEVAVKYGNVDIIRSDLIDSNQYLCLGQIFKNLRITNYYGYDFQWQKSIDDKNYSNILNATQNELTNKQIDTLKETTFFRCLVKNDVCTADTSKGYKIKISYSPPEAGTLTYSQIICTSDNINTLKILNTEGDSFYWQYALDTTSQNSWNYLYRGNLDSLENSKIYVNKLLSFFVRVIVSNTTNKCGSSKTKVIRIKKDYVPNIGGLSLIGNNTSICQGEAGLINDLNAGSWSGDSIIWLKSSDNNIWDTILNGFSGNGILKKEKIGILNESIYLKAIAVSGVCKSAVSNIINIEVKKKPIGGFLSETDQICYNTNHKTIKLFGYYGDMGVQWQYSTPTKGWTNIYGNNSDSITANQLGKITNKTFIRAMINSSNCETVYSNIDTISIFQPSSPGTISSNQLICSGTYPTDISITGGIGNLTWQKSINANTWSDIPNSFGSILSSNKAGLVSIPTYYRGVQTSGTCPSVYTPIMTVNIDSVSYAGTTSSNQSLCTSTSSGAVSVTKPRGTLQWQTSTDGYYYTNILNATTTSYQPGLLASTSYYRMQATNGVCPAVFSAPIQITIAPKSISGSLSANQTICSGTQPENINLSNANGTVNWQSSLNNTTWSSVIGVTGTTLTSAQMGNLTSQKYYRATVKSGACTSVTSNSVSIGIRSNPIVSGGSNLSICPNTSISLTGSGAVSYVWSNGVQNNISFTPSSTTTYSVTGTDASGCTGTSQVTVMVYPNPTVQISSNNPVIICQGTPFNLTSSATNVSSYQWKLNGSNLSGALSSSLTTKLEGNYSLVVQSSNGCPASSNILNIKLSPKPTISTIQNQTICLGDKIQLQAFDASNYTWNTGNQNGDQVYPTNSTKYIVSTTDTVSGCTNSDTMFVKVNSPSSSIINTTSLGSFNLNNISYYKSGQYIQKIKNVAGCDSTITLNLFVESLGLTDLESGNIVIYPNPSPDGKFSIKSDYEIDEIRIMNCEGKTLEILKNNKEIDISMFGRGVYFVELEGNTINNIFKLVY